MPKDNLSARGGEMCKRYGWVGVALLALLIGYFAGFASGRRKRVIELHFILKGKGVELPRFKTNETR